MLDISKRLSVINALLEEDTVQSLTYAALECRLTLEYLCYERFKLSYAYLSIDDLKNWQPRHVVKQVSDDIDENITKGFKLSVSNQRVDGKSPETKEEFESLEYHLVGQQPGLNINKLHSLWHGLANVALHIPVPTISSGEISIYGGQDKIKNKVRQVVLFLQGIDGNLLMGGSLGPVFNFNCLTCDSLIKKTVKALNSPAVVNCINPECSESYYIEPEDYKEGFRVTRRIFQFACKRCNGNLDVPSKLFRELKLDQQLNIVCGSCHTSLTVIMRPLMKDNVD
ncbi:hypothetical protein DN062_05245 [Nitrincola tibetensis]|uniref:Uncharacterized protein n=1 Tax=Nitrincola tibetensis TaxID=2219697 RepID=A0A364NP62_9GAMM|nr:hypothetical protein [Nitrincola tibetensis]RAU18889.1 hypothetical protein DN062_05245 [Nitrincola tibetensis]